MAADSDCAVGGDRKTAHAAIFPGDQGVFEPAFADGPDVDQSVISAAQYLVSTWEEQRRADHLAVTADILGQQSGLYIPELDRLVGAGAQELASVRRK